MSGGSSRGLFGEQGEMVRTPIAFLETGAFLSRNWVFQSNTVQKNSTHSAAIRLLSCAKSHKGVQ